MENKLVLSALLTPGMNAGLWVVAIVLLVVYMMRRRSRKEKDQNSLR